MNRNVLWGVLVIGLALVIAPFALSLPSKAAAGERMLNQFEPIMQPSQVQTTATYYYDVFTPLRKVVPAMSAANVEKFNGYLTGLQTATWTPEQQKMVQPMGRDFASLLALMQANVAIFAKVPAGLDHYRPLVTTMQKNVDNYQQVNSLPSFRLFTWFFVVPGVLLVLLAGTGLLAGRDLAWPTIVHHHGRPTHA